MPTFPNRHGLELFFHDWGTGRPLVFVHGGALNGDCWEYQMVPLSEQGFRCVAADTRGCGRSEQPGHGYAYGDLAGDLDDLLAHLDLDDAVLVGHSMGCATIIRRLATHGTGRVGAVVLVSPTTPFVLQTDDNPGGVPAEVFEASTDLLRVNRPLWIEMAAGPFFGAAPGTEEQPSELIEWGKGLARSSGAKATMELFGGFYREDLRGDLAACTVPTLVVHGDADQTAPIDLCGRPTAAGIPGARLELYEGGSHGIFLSHAPRLAADIAAFATP